ncbi:MAG: hypothetical protein M0C28_11670 [Candidatus Moduliflexus flocculans]|nr:hypothetical protein [Candidatus Moduliflexus flocculans]
MEPRRRRPTRRRAPVECLVSRHGRTRSRIRTLGCGDTPRCCRWRCSGPSACATGSIRDGTYRDAAAIGSACALPPARWQSASLEGAALAFRAPDLDAGMGLRADCGSPGAWPPPLGGAPPRSSAWRTSRIETREPAVGPCRTPAACAPGCARRLDGRPVEVDGVTHAQRGVPRTTSCMSPPPERFEEGRPDFDAFVQELVSRARAVGMRTA